MASVDNLERLLDRVADALVLSEHVSSDQVVQLQKTIRGGLITLRGDSTEPNERLVLYQKDVKANQEDLKQTTTLDDGTVISELENFANSLEGQFDSVGVSIELVGGEIAVVVIGGNLPDGGFDITPYIAGEGNPLNLSQFIPIPKKETQVDVEKANEFLDTNIYELLPSSDARQARITRLFQELNALLPPQLPAFDLDENGMVDRAPNNTWLNAEQYSQNNSISYAQDNEDGNIEEEEAFIHRLKSTANDTNSSKTIQDIYNRVLPYLTDILEEPPIPQDQRPVYQNQSSGYMKFRHLNQGIIIRNTNSEFIDGLDPNNPRYLSTGFTITMWVRFLDKKSEGTLFNFGNPTRNQPDMNWNRVPDGLGFKLETYVVNRNNYTGYPTDDRRYDTFGDFSDLFINDNRPYGYVSMDSGKAIYENTDSARFVRLVVNGLDSEGNPGWLRSSETGNSTFSKYTWNTPDLDFQPDATNNGGPYNQWDELRAVSGTHIPEDFDEWYFICATYNPNIIEPDRYNTLGNSNSGDNLLYKNYAYNYNFWMNHYLPNNSQDGGGSLVANSGYGNQCKVEIISRSDLLRARGFRV